MLYGQTADEPCVSRWSRLVIREEKVGSLQLVTNQEVARIQSMPRLASLVGIRSESSIRRTALRNRSRRSAPRDPSRRCSTQHGYWRTSIVVSMSEQAPAAQWAPPGVVRAFPRPRAVVNAAARLREVLRDRGVQVRDRYAVSLSRQAMELSYAYWRYGMGRAEYYMFEFYRRDMTPDTKQTFLSQNAWTALALLINQPDRHSDDSKLVLGRRLEGRGIEVPRILASTSVHPSDRDRRDPFFLPLDAIGSAIPPSGCVIKPDRSTWGKGIFVATSFDGRLLRLVDGRESTPRELLTSVSARPGLTIIQERLLNHPALDVLQLPSLATLRVLTYGAETPAVLRAAFKLPVGKSGVDNYHAGGIAAPVKLDSGAVGAGVNARSLDWCAAHPDTGGRFAGLTVPDWNRACELVCRAAAALPEFPCVGWDVAVTPRGPVLIEGNSTWGTDIVQRPHRTGLWKGAFREWCLDRVANKGPLGSLTRWIGVR